MKHDVSKNKDILTVKVKLKRLNKDAGDVPKKVWPSDILKLVQDKYNVIGYLKNPVIVSSYDEDVEAEYTFKLKEEKTRAKRKTSRRTNSKSEKSDSTEESDEEES